MKSFRVPIFGTRIHYTTDPVEAQKWLDDNGHEWSIRKVDGCCCEGKGLMVYCKNTSHGLVAHESYHAACRVLEGCGAGNDEETLAHLTQYIADKVAK